MGGLDPGLTEGDVITIFSQYGEPVDINLPKAKNEASKTESGNPNLAKLEATKPKTGSIRSRGFCFLMYENQLSTNLAVDNLNGALVLGRTLRVDHCKNYKQLERTSEGKMTERDADLGERLNALPELHAPVEDRDGSEDLDEIDPEDPMAGYLLEQRQKQRKKEGKKKAKASDADSDGKRERKHRRRDDEDELDRRARKDAKRAKKLLKEGGSSNRIDDRGE